MFYIFFHKLIPNDLVIHLSDVIFEVFTEYLISVTLFESLSLVNLKQFLYFIQVFLC